MPTPSTSFDSVISLPPRVVGIRHALLDVPSATSPSVAIPPNYKLYMSPNLPSGFTDPDGVADGDWLFSNHTSGVFIYQMIGGSWILKTSLSGGGGGGGGGPLNGETLTNCLFQNGTITGSTISTSTLVSPAITTPVITGGTIAAPVISTPVITNPVITGGTIDGAAITNVPSPVLPGDAANKQYVDGMSQGFIIHDPCRVATTGSNINLSGGAPDTLDGISLNANDRILVKDQTNPVQNGIYYVSTLGSGANGTWTRATDADLGQELDTAYVLVQSGTANGGTSWVVSGTPLIDTDPVTWVQFFAVTSIPATAITGSIVAGQIGSVNAGAILGTITAGQIATINAGQIAGTITASQIGSVNATSISGLIQAAQIQAVNATAIAGSISATQIGSVNATTIVGVITSTQLVDQILNTQRLIASDISVVKRVASLPSLPSADYPAGSLVLNTTNKTLYQNVAGAWSVVTASSNVVGTLTSNDIASVNASSIIGLIIASQIGSVNATSLVGGITSSQITSVNASAITGSISASQIGSVNASAITGTISSSQIASVNASAITGTISSTQIGSVNASTITLGSLSAITYQLTGSTAGNSTTIDSTGLTVGFLKIDGTTNQNTISINGLNPISITGGALAASVTVGNSGISGAVVITNSPTSQITVVGIGSIGANASSRFTMASVSTTSIAFTTNGSERWIIGGSDGHLKSMSSSYDIRKASSDGWSVPMFDGSNWIEFRWDGGFQIRVDFSSEYDVTIT